MGHPGAAGDAQIYNGSDLKRLLERGQDPYPAADPLPYDDRDTPYFLVGDDAFSMTTNLMKPYGRRNLPHDEQIFNYRLSRCRRVVENSFSILVARWRCLLNKLLVRPQHAQHIVHACVCLHNLMRIRYPQGQNHLLDREDGNHDLIPGAWREGRQLLGLHNIGGNRQTRAGKLQRDYLKHYYCSPAGSVPWQERMLGRANIIAHHADSDSN